MLVREVLHVTHTPDYQVVTGSASGMTSIRRVPDAPLTGLSNYIASDYNTGWMVGDIKLATLSNTDTTNAVGTELVTNGTFDSNVTGWTTNGGSSVSHQSGQAKVTASSTNILLTQQLSGLVVGQKYTFSATITPFIGASGAYWGAYLSSSYSNNIGNFSVTDQVATKVSATFTATATNNYISLGGSSGAISNGEYLLVDNFSVRLAEVDRSVNNNGLQVFGTVSKTPVASGAELVSYGNFESNTAYLVRPYNSDTQFGTGDFSLSYWINDNAPSEDVRHFWLNHDLSSTTETSEGFNIGSWNGQIRLLGVHGAISTSVTYPANVWTFVHIQRKLGVVHLYINDKLKYSVAYTHDVNATKGCVIGNRGYSSQIFGLHGQLALMRLSATAPSAEQIAKIYNDEKHLFKENAKATLYGASDAVTALAYDDDTELLHAGTSAGRSVFRGLNRVDNTTDAVGAAISASNGLVAED